VSKGGSHPLSVDSEVPAEMAGRQTVVISLPVPITRDAEFEEPMRSNTHFLPALSLTTEAVDLGLTFSVASSMTAGCSATNINAVQPSCTVPMHQPVDEPESPPIIHAANDAVLDLDHSPGAWATDEDQNNNSCSVPNQNTQQPAVDFNQPVIVQQGTLLGESTPQVRAEAQQFGRELPRSVVLIPVSQQPSGEAQIRLRAQLDSGNLLRSVVLVQVSRHVSGELRVRSNMQQAGCELTRALMSVLTSTELRGDRQKQNQLSDRSKKMPEHRRDKN